MDKKSAGKTIGLYRRIASNAMRGASANELVVMIEESLGCTVMFEAVSNTRDDADSTQAESNCSRLTFDMYGKLAHFDAISLVRDNIPFSADEIGMAEYLVDIIALTIADHERAKAIRWQATKGLVSSLLDGSYSDSISIAEAANTIAFDIDGSYRIMSIEIERNEQAKNDSDNLRHDQIVCGVEKIANEFIQTSTEGLALKMDGRVVLLVRDPNENRYEEIARGTAAKLLPVLKKKYPKTRFTICIGSVCKSYTQYESAFQLIEQVVELNKSVGKGDEVISLKQFGAKALFYSALRPEALLQFSSVRLKPLIEYDREQSGNLVKTLRTYLDCGGNVSQAAQQLFISYGGMRYRLREIESLTNTDLKKPGVIYEMFFALDVLEIAGEDAVLSR